MKIAGQRQGLEIWELAVIPYLINTCYLLTTYSADDLSEITKELESLKVEILTKDAIIALQNEELKDTNNTEDQDKGDHNKDNHSEENHNKKDYNKGGSQ